MIPWYSWFHWVYFESSLCRASTLLACEGRVAAVVTLEYNVLDNSFVNDYMSPLLLWFCEIKLRTIAICIFGPVLLIQLYYLITVRSGRYRILTSSKRQMQTISRRPIPELLCKQTVFAISESCNGHEKHALQAFWNEKIGTEKNQVSISHTGLLEA